VDRIGQTRSVHATLLVARHPAEQLLLSSLARRTLAAQSAFGSTLLASVAPPTELAVARALLTGEPLPVTRPDPGPSFQPCTRWKRPAAALAKQLNLKRTLASRWRRESLGSRPVRCFLRRRQHRLGRLSASTAVYTVPFTDGSGIVVERHLLILSIDPGFQPGSAETTRAVRSMAARLLEARRRRVTKLVADAARLRGRTEKTIGDYLHDVWYPERTQTELFTHRASREFDDGRRNAQDVDEASQSAIAELQRSAHIEIGEPTLEMIFIAR
jgi:hypothetical protein